MIGIVQRAGFTRRVFGSSSMYDLTLMVRPGDDLDGTFRAWDVDASEWLNVNGWLFVWEDDNAAQAA